eukprot:1448633-Pyramimonas_sp.AAC.1
MAAAFSSEPSAFVSNASNCYTEKGVVHESNYKIFVLQFLKHDARYISARATRIHGGSFSNLGFV